MMRGYGYGYNMMGGGWFGIVAAIFWLLVIAGVVVLIVWGIRQLSSGAHGHRTPGTGYYAEQGRQDDACNIARTRYAKGEISREEYAEICRNLGVPGPPPPVGPTGPYVAPGQYRQPAPPPPQQGQHVWVPPAVAQRPPVPPTAGGYAPPPQQGPPIGQPPSPMPPVGPPQNPAPPMAEQGPPDDTSPAGS